MTIVNQTVPRALMVLGYTKAQIDDIVNFIDTEKTIEGAPHIKPDHLAVFSCSMGFNPIHYSGHIRMMGAVQPFISGAISKTVNMPEEASVEDIEQLHVDAWKLGIKAVAVYRDNCKVGQPLSMMKKGADANNNIEATTTAPTIDAVNSTVIVKGAVRRPLPKVRPAKTYSFTVADCHGYFTVGEYEDGNIGELFVSVAKMGSTLSGLMDSFGRSISYGLQYGVPLKVYVKGMTAMSFAPSGITDDKEIRTAASLVDYIFRRLATDYLNFDDRLELGLASFDDMPAEQTSLLGDNAGLKVESQNTQVVNVSMDVPSTEVKPVVVDKPVVAAAVASAPKVTKKTIADQSAPMCYNCGNQTQRAGSCYVCTSCGSTTGCS